MTRVLLVGMYELGRQPLEVARPAGVLREGGHSVRVLDLAVEEVDWELFRWAELIGIAASMHTAARLGVGLARRLAGEGLGGRAVLYGLGANGLGEMLVREGAAMGALTGDADLQLLGLADGDRAVLAGGAVFDRRERPAPDRSGLPGLERYARYRDAAGGLHLAGAVEATRGCAHSCTHCPLTPVYGGRLRLNGAEGVLADIGQLAEMGAEHVTFADADFLNAPGYVMGILREARTRHAEMTFDATIKVEHLLEHAALLPELAALGVTFVTSAFESVDDRLLGRLEKGHSAADLAVALEACRGAGLALRPTWLPFTPWTSGEDYLALLRFVEEEGLVDLTPPVQLGLRLLLPPGSPLIADARADGVLGEFDGDGLTWTWRHPDGAMDELQREAAALAEAGAGFGEIKRAACERLGVAAWPDLTSPHVHAPGMTEDWFC